MALILLVEDSKFTRNRLRQLLAADGYDVVEAENGRIALEKIEAATPDCLVTDLNMPEMDGISLLRALREREVAFPILVVTADIQDAVRTECLELGASKLLHKPPRPDELSAAVRDALANRKAPAKCR